MSDKHSWANVILNNARDEQAERVVQAVNNLTATRDVNAASVIVAYAQILAQSITQAPPDVAAEVRNGILTMIDDFATHFAVIEP